MERETDRQSWQHRLSPSVRSAHSPHSKISLGEREGSTLYLMMPRQELLSVGHWAGEQGEIYGQDPGGEGEGGARGERELVNPTVKNLPHESRSDCLSVRANPQTESGSQMFLYECFCIKAAANLL